VNRQPRKVRWALFEHENAPFYCLEAEISTPTARGSQTLVRLKVRNLLTGAVLDKTFKVGEKFRILRSDCLGSESPVA
jgi:elongation factor P